MDQQKKGSFWDMNHYKSRNGRHLNRAGEVECAIGLGQEIAR